MRSYITALLPLLDPRTQEDDRVDPSEIFSFRPGREKETHARGITKTASSPDQIHSRRVGYPMR